MYDAVNRDVLARWTHPYVPEIMHEDHTLKHEGTKVWLPQYVPWAYRALVVVELVGWRVISDGKVLDSRSIRELQVLWNDTSGFFSIFFVPCSHFQEGAEQFQP